MSVLPVRKISLVALRADSESIIESLHTVGVLHIDVTGESFADEKFLKRLSGNETKLHYVRKAVWFLKRFQAIPTAIPPKSLQAESLFEKVHSIRERCEFVDKRIIALKEAIAVYSPFGEFNHCLNALSAAGLIIKLAYVSDGEMNFITNCDAIHVVSSANSARHAVVLITRADADVGISTLDPPEQPLPVLRAELTKLETEAFALKEDASRWAYQLRKLETLAEKTEERVERLTELKKARDFDQLIGFSGYVLQRDVITLKQALDKHCVALSIEEPTEIDTVPVMLDNARPLRGFEAIVKAFTGVNYFEKDKTGIVALLFMFFGALCLLDAGYGFLLFLAGYVVAIKKSRDFGQVFMWTGAISTILGLLCGQVFGLTLAQDILLNIPPLLTLATDPMACFKFSLLVGVFAMTLTNMVAIFQNGIKTHATGSLLALLGVITLIVKESELFIGRFYDPAFVLNNVAIGFFSLSVLSWLLFPEPVFGKKKRVANILWMFYAGPLGLVQDVLSHMRLFGIALSGSILALVINKICALLPFPFGIVFAPIGHFTIFLLSLLSLYIHANRLIFLEFGTKCMSGGNIYFKPFSRRT